MTIKFWVASAMVLNLVGCATLSKEDCLKGDWASVGQADGRQGYPVTRFQEHEKACVEYQVRPNFEAYQAGRNEGLREFCTPDNGYELGRQVKAYEDVCPAELKDAFLGQYGRGLDSALRTNEEQLDEAEVKLSRKERQLSYLDPKQDKERNQLTDEIKALESTVNSLQSSRLTIIELREKIRSLREF